jgi:hypothetical protein
VFTDFQWGTFPLGRRVGFPDTCPRNTTARCLGTGSTRESRLPLHAFQPQSNPKYHCSQSLYDSLALFQTPNHALQLVENTVVTSLITQKSRLQIIFHQHLAVHLHRARAFGVPHEFFAAPTGALVSSGQGRYVAEGMPASQRSSWSGCFKEGFLTEIRSSKSLCYVPL